MRATVTVMMREGHRKQLCVFGDFSLDGAAKFAVEALGASHVIRATNSSYKPKASNRKGNYFRF